MISTVCERRWGSQRGVLQGKTVTVSVGMFFLGQFIAFGEWELKFPATHTTQAELLGT